MCHSLIVWDTSALFFQFLLQRKQSAEFVKKNGLIKVGLVVMIFPGNLKQNFSSLLPSPLPEDSSDPQKSQGFFKDYWDF